MAGLSLNFLGANNFMWRSKHNIIHHTYTNIEGIDDDIEAKPLLRLCETQKYYKIHRFQHWYFWQLIRYFISGGFSLLIIKNISSEE